MSIINKKITNVPIAQFETNIAAPLASLTLPLSPVQSFNGYDGPWPGGAGKNKLPIAASMNPTTAAGVTWTPAENGWVTVTGTPTGLSIRNYNHVVLPPGTYVVSCIPDTAPTSVNAAAFVLSKNQYGSSGAIVSGRSDGEREKTFTLDEETDCYLRLYVYAVAGTITDYIFKPMIRLATESADWEPYENICPISGWDGANVTAAGKNLLKTVDSYPSWLPRITKNSDGSWKVEGRRTGNDAITLGTVILKAGITYTLNGTGSGDLYYQLVGGGTTRVAGIKSLTITPTATEVYTFRLFAQGGIEYDTTLYPQIEIGTEATTYEPSAATVYPVTWSEAGTVYGGEVDIVSGELTVTRVGFKFSDLTWTVNAASSHSFNGNVSARKAKSNLQSQIISSLYEHFSSSALGDEDYGIAMAGNGNTIYVRDVSCTDGDVSDFLTKRGDIQATYLLATPQTCQLTPTQVLTLLGANNVWSDTGNITLEYPFRVFDIIRVKINGTDITDYIAFQGLKRGRNDVESPNAGRTLDAVMHRGRVATKLRWDITCRPLTSQELSILENLIMPETVNVTIEGDPYYDTWTRRCYANNTSASYLILKPDGRQLWGGITFPIIEV